MTHELTLTPRLRRVADLVPDGARLADIGTDHAYLPAWLLLSGRLSRAIAADLREGPLDRARETAAFYGLTDQMEFRLCDGLAGISPEETDTVVIAGMGGETIAGILAAAPWTAQGAHRLLLQPMTSQEDLRGWLAQNGYSIQEEHLAREGKTLYTIMSARGGAAQPCSELDCLIGRFSVEEPELGAYLAEHLTRIERRLRGLKRSRQADAQSQYEIWQRRYDAVEKMKKEWDYANRP